MTNDVCFRIAKVSDAKKLASIHVECGNNQTDSFMPKLGTRFMTAYYKVMLSSKASVVVMAYRKSDNECLGFHSGTSEAADSQKYLASKKYYLAFAALTSLATKPSLLREIFKRYRVIKENKDNLIINVGPRGEYWAWKPGASPIGGAVEVHKRWHHLMYALGCDAVRSEVNQSNSKVRKAAQAMGGKMIRETRDLNGMVRLFVEINLSEYCARFPLQ